MLQKGGRKRIFGQIRKRLWIYLDVDSFIEGMKKKLEEIKTYKQLLEFVESDFGKDKTGMEIIIDAYDKAKEKNYITSQNIQQNNINNRKNNNNNIFEQNNFNQRNINIRGRRRGRGRGMAFQFRGRRGIEGRRSRSRSRSRYDN